MKEQPLILNLESATGVCSVSVSKGEEVLAFQEADETFQHSKVLTGLIDKCLKSSDLELNSMDAVAVSSGPGSYTSLRVGISTAKGICYALNKPMLSVDTLQSLALAAGKGLSGDDVLICPMIDARRMEVYCNMFDVNGHPLEEPVARVIDEASFANYFKAGKTIVFCGNGADKCREVLSLQQAIFRPSECSAMYFPPISSRLYKEEKFVDVAYFTPNYLKPPNITVPKKWSHLKTGKIQ